MVSHGKAVGGLVLYDSDFVPEPGQPYAESFCFIQIQRASELGRAFHPRMSVTNQTDCWNESWGIYISERISQQHDDLDCSVYAIMKDIQLNFGTNALSHDRVLRTCLMLMLAVLCDLFFLKEEQHNNRFQFFIKYISFFDLMF